MQDDVTRQEGVLRAEVSAAQCGFTAIRGQRLLPLGEDARRVPRPSDQPMELAACPILYDVSRLSAG